MTRRLAFAAAAALLVAACNRADRPSVTAPIAKPAASLANTKVGMLPDSIYVLVNGKEMPRADVAKIAASSIDKVEVLKGAAAIAQYGERASKGVILITTKQ
jgi:TonB-dependent SusC/RagA subfamily outer membrane receptor